MNKLVVVGIIIFVVFFSGFSGAFTKFFQNNPQDIKVVNQKSGENVSIATPEHLSIPKIGVDASIEQVGLDAEKRMDVPQNPDNVAWYSLGYKPGEKGNTVISGHLDKADGSPAVFWNIDDLVPGDTFSVSGESGKKLTFSVEKKAKYSWDNFPIHEVFGESKKSMLNLITCEGEWNALTKNYSHRVVIYARLAH